VVITRCYVYHRVIVEPINERSCSVFYVDYGNVDKVIKSDLRVLPDEVWNAAPVATPFCYIGNFKSFNHYHLMSLISFASHYLT